jgi:CheY-like chemotaxis protein
MGKKILLADDSITIQKVIELTFSDEDFDVVTVGNGRLALEKLPEVRPDIVLCDIIMPEKDGYEVCEQIKRNPAFAHTPVLLLTGAFEPFDQDRATRAGFDGSLAKPFEPETLIAKVKELLARGPGAVPATNPPSVVPFQRPSPPALSPPPLTARPASFIADEPMVGVEEEAVIEDRTVPGEQSPAERLVDISQEEAEALAPPPALPSQEDNASTVMFRAGDLPWNAPQPPAERGSSLPVTAFEPEPTEEPEVVIEEVEAAPETPAFEEVLEEDLEFGPDSFEGQPEAPPAADAESATVMFMPEVGTLPPVAREQQESATGRFTPVQGEPRLAPAAARFPPPVPPPLPREATPPAPAPTRETPIVIDPGVASRDPVFKPEPARAIPPLWEGGSRPSQTAPVPAAPRPAPVAPPEPRPEERPAAASFADVSESVVEEAPPAPPVSEAGALSVPVEMVEKIAQRVVAQISEKAVREIAWEVIPDLAEALIKQEIERLKAELQKL